MNRFLILSILSVASTFFPGAVALTQEAPPPWAYPVNPPDFKPPPDDGTLRHVPDSTASMTLTQVRDLFYAPDWHPGDHPPMPEVVASGRKPNVFACGVCHRADGPGGPENANLMGLPAAYIVQQLADFKSGARKSSVPDRIPTKLKTTLAANVTDAEVQAAAAYFSALKPRAVIRVVETEMVPKTIVSGWFLTALNTGEREPTGERIIEVPENLEQFVSRDTRSRFIAYVPTGSIEKGRALAASGEQAVRCGTCHGPDLKGLGAVPGIAGRSPSYLVRQLYDFKHGTRAGADSAQMKPSVEKLSIRDMISLAAYAASLAP
ncbi:MAG: cytochrome C-binding protein [Tardiphaga sp.]|jgi:cytochrome c553|nr:cytochrome C-binding protein [Tardiphaga sp.]